MRYVFVTLKGGEAFEQHSEAWNMYENHDEEFRGVFEITSHGVSPINVSGNTFDDRSRELKQMAKHVADRHRV